MQQVRWGIVACLAPSSPWCALRDLEASIVDWWLDSRDKWASPLFVLVYMTLLNNSTPEARTVSRFFIISFIEPQFRSDIVFVFTGSDVGIGSRLLAGCTTGAMAVAFAQPTDVVKVRFQAQATSSEYARRYCGTIDAYKTIGKEEGIRGLWKGNLIFKNKKVCVLKASVHVNPLTQVRRPTLHAMLLLTAQNWWHMTSLRICCLSPLPWQVRLGLSEGPVTL